MNAKLSSHPRFHACPTRNLLQLKVLSPPFAQSETQPTTAFSVAGCATGSARLLSAQKLGRASQPLLRVVPLQVKIVATEAGVSRPFLVTLNFGESTFRNCPKRGTSNALSVNLEV
jgi:hypothetical protein